MQIENHTAMDANLPTGIKPGFRHILLVLMRPVETFRTVADSKSAWIYPFLATVVLLLIGFIYGAVSPTDDSALDPKLDLLGYSEQSLVIVITVIALLIFGLPLYFFLAYLIPAAVFMFFGNFVFERHLGLKQYLNITAYALVPGIILALINLIVMFLTGGRTISFSPVSFLPGELQTTFIGYWLSMFSLFNIWIITLLTVGLSTILEQTRLRTVAWLIPLFLALITGAAFMFSFMGRIVQEYGSF